MKRSELRECTFLLLFREAFHSAEEMPEQAALVADPEGQDVLEGTGRVLSEKDAKAVTARYALVADRIEEIDKALNERTLGWDTKRIGKVELAILRLAVYEICYDEAVSSAVAINEAVELAKRYGQEGSASFVNGVLAKFA